MWQNLAKHFALHLAEVYSEPYQTSKIEFFSHLVNSFHSSNIFAKSSILDASQGSEYATVQ